jgi:DNA-binding transcriptional regulator YiaG
MRKLITGAYFFLCLALVGVGVYKFVLVSWHSFSLQDVLLGMVDDDLKLLSKKQIALESEQVDLQIAKTQAKKGNLHFELVVRNTTQVALLVAGCSALLIISIGVHHKLSVHQISIGNSTLKVRYCDMQTLGTVQNGLVLAEQLRANSETEGKALEMSLKISEVVTRQLQAVAGRRGIFGHSQQVIDIAPSQQPVLPSPIRVPTFGELLSAGEIAPGKPLILGYRDTGHPEKGELSDLYSTIVIGLSGYGKTTFLGFVIASSVIAEEARFDILDLHYPAAESLGATLGKLKESPYIRIISNPFELPELLSELRAEMAQRLKTPNQKHTPRILVVDEHERWSKHSNDLVSYEIDCVNEGRKVGMFLFITSKSAKGDKIGDTALRDNCVTSYVFKTKPQNARTFFKDRDKERLVNQIKQPGQAVFTNRYDDSHLVKIPMTSPGDMLTVCDLMHQAHTPKPEALTIREIQTPPRRSASTPDHTPELETLWQEFEQSTNSSNTVRTPFEQSEQVFKLTPDACKQLRESVGISQSELAERANVSLSKLKRFELQSAQFELSELNQIQQVLLMNHSTGALN